MTEKTIQVNGMTCQHCVMAVKKELSKLNLENAEVEIGSVKVKFDETKIDESKIEEAIVEAGYQVVK